jgi:activator of HSP90 ATPase
VPKDIAQTVTFSAAPRRVYDTLMDAKKHAAIIDGDVTMPKRIGARFSAYGGEIQGENVELVPGKRIVQTWRYDDWPAGHYSLIVIDLKAAGTKTRMAFRQISVPDAKAREIAEGWRLYYWDPMEAAFTGR